MERISNIWEVLAMEGESAFPDQLPADGNGSGAKQVVQGKKRLKLSDDEQLKAIVKLTDKTLEFVVRLKTERLRYITQMLTKLAAEARGRNER
ncbi:MAG: hypothetical protein IH984_06940 [Planctomycetes bacterium]|nr:hypothetical protein [Planctomycetota bacterium]